MEIKLINIGFGNMVAANRIVAIVSPESAPIKRIIQESRDRGTLIDATYGRRTRAVIIVDSLHVILSAVQPETVAHRLNTKEAVNNGWSTICSFRSFRSGKKYGVTGSAGEADRFNLFNFRDDPSTARPRSRWRELLFFIESTVFRRD